MPVLTDTKPVIKWLMTGWETLTVTQLHLARFINAGLGKLCEGYNKMDQTWAYVLTLSELHTHHDVPFFY